MPFNILSSLVNKVTEDFRDYRRAFVTLLVLTAALFISQIWGNGQISGFWKDIQPHNQQYTELAFLDPNNLPTGLDSSNSLSFGFMVHNVEGIATNYKYVISVKEKTGVEIIKSGYLTLANNDHLSLNQTLSIPSQSNPQEVIVSLPAQHESIDLLLNRSAS